MKGYVHCYLTGVVPESRASNFSIIRPFYVNYRSKASPEDFQFPLSRGSLSHFMPANLFISKHSVIHSWVLLPLVSVILLSQNIRYRSFAIRGERRSIFPLKVRLWCLLPLFDLWSILLSSYLVILRLSFAVKSHAAQSSTSLDFVKRSLHVLQISVAAAASFTKNLAPATAQKCGCTTHTRSSQLRRSRASSCAQFSGHWRPVDCGLIGDQRFLTWRCDLLSKSLVISRCHILLSFFIVALRCFAHTRRCCQHQQKYCAAKNLAEGPIPGAENTQILKP